MLLIFILAAALHLGTSYLINRELPTTTENPIADELSTAYFAYGSNMSSRYLYNVRGVLTTNSQAGSIEGHEVKFFGPGSNKLEPAFSYLVENQNETAFGVLHYLAESDLQRIRNSESSNYQWETLPVKLKNGQVVEARTLLRRKDGEPGVPSRRYLELLIEGATEHDLPGTYVDTLSSRPSIYFPIASELVGDVLQLVVMKQSRVLE